MPVKDFMRFYLVEKEKIEIFVFKVGKSVILCQFIRHLTQIPDNDRLSRRIRGYFGCKGSLSTPHRDKKTASGGGQQALCYQQGI